jgi:hypothetical protein
MSNPVICYHRYARFRILTLTVGVKHGAKNEYYLMDSSETVANQTEVQFCIDFVVDCALALQESDFEITLKEHPSLKDMF